MPYTAEITRNSPACFIFMVDHSSSMLEPIGGQEGKSKSQGVAEAINRLLQNLVLKCAKSDGIRDYFQVGLIGYGGRVGSAFGGALAGQHVVPVSLLANNPLRIEQRKRTVDDGAGGLVETVMKFPIWFDPKPSGRTPMCEALKLAYDYVTAFVGLFPAAYPPLVVNITDGMSTDGDPTEAAEKLKKLGTRDGEVVLFNAHVSAQEASPVQFPASEAGLADGFARLLFRMSSVLPPRLLEAARGDGFPAQPGTRGFVFNADLVSVIRFLDIGTRVSRSAR